MSNMSDIGNDPPPNPVENVIALAQQIQQATPFISDMLISFVDGMKGKLALGLLTQKVEETFGPELAPVIDLLRRVNDDYALAKASLVRKIMDTYQLSEGTALEIAGCTMNGTLNKFLETVKTSMPARVGRKYERPPFHAEE